MLQGLLRLGVCEIGAAALHEARVRRRWPYSATGFRGCCQNTGTCWRYLPVAGAESSDHGSIILVWKCIPRVGFGSAQQLNFTTPRKLDRLARWTWTLPRGWAEHIDQSPTVHTLLLLRANKLCSSADKRACCCEGWNEQRLAVATQSLEFEKDKWDIYQAKCSVKSFTVFSKTFAF